MDRIPDVASATSEQDPCKQGLLRLLARGEKEIQTGEGSDLDAVLAEADALLREMQR